MNWFASAVASINDVLWSYVLIIMLIGIGLWFTFASRFVQITNIREMFRCVLEGSRTPPPNGHISPFQAFCISTASRVGVGNIAGIAIAVVTGGPGAIFWMWVIATIGAASGFIESTLAQIYKIRKPGGGFLGGPAYYIKNALGSPFFAGVFAVLISVTYGLIFNLFGKGADFPAQMKLILCKIGRFYHASDVLVSVLRSDFSSNYLDYQWHKGGGMTAENVRPYRQEERDIFYKWLGQNELRYLSEEESGDEIIQRFLGIMPGRHGIVLPMYDNGDYMGNICIVGIEKSLLDNSEEYQNLAELGRVIQSQLTQKQHDIASKAKSDFLSRMSHEIRTPMNGIIGMTAIALQQEQSHDRIMDCLQKIQSSSNYLLGLINDILDMSKIESGKMKLEAVNFDIHEMLGTIRELIMTQAAAKKIDFVQEIEVTNTWFVADKMRISQVLINLLGNAVKFTPAKGRVTLTVREEKTLEKESVVYFAVRDTGIGIAKEDQKRVFRSFEQATDRNPSKQQGTGLGLSISSRLIQMMGSSIQLDSELGEGSTFSFSILLEKGENMETQAQEEEITFEGCRILVVEDNELNAEIALTLLEERGFAVDCVYDGSEAVERIRTTKPGTYDVILMDIMMPIMDGLEATRTIRSMEREDCRTIPIVAMSANAFDDDLKKSVECGMNGHLSKPVEVDKLYRTLGEIIHGSRTRQERPGV